MCGPPVDTLRIEWTRFQSYMHEKLSLQKHGTTGNSHYWYIAFHTKITTACVNAKKKNPCEITGLEITAGQRTMSGLIVDLTGQTFVLPVMLTGQNSVVLKMK